jgi:hypothetical protein
VLRRIPSSSGCSRLAHFSALQRWPKGRQQWFSQPGARRCGRS